MLPIAPKANLVRTSPSRVTVVIEPSVAAQWQASFSFEDLAGGSENIAPGRVDQATQRWRQNRVEPCADMAARSTFEPARRFGTLFAHPNLRERQLLADFSYRPECL